MPESIAAYYGATAAGSAAAGTAAAGTAAAGTAAAAGGVAAAGTAAAAGGGLLGTIGTAAATAAITAGVSKLLAPGRPDLPNPVAMPDAQAQEEARKRAIIEQTTRRGRASTVLTDSAGTLGG